MFAIAIGNAFDGMLLIGPLETQDEALEVAQTDYANENWLLVELTPAAQVAEVATPSTDSTGETTIAEVSEPIAADDGDAAWDALKDMASEAPQADEIGPVQAVSEVAPTLDDKVAMLASTVDALLQRVERMAEGFAVAMRRVQDQLAPAEPAPKRERKPKAGPSDYNAQMAATAKQPKPIKLSRS